MRILSTFVLVFILSTADGAQRKKDFRGLFGSYRGERLIENLGNESDTGFYLGFGTLIPINGVVSSIETSGTSATPMYFSTFFNIEGGVFLTFAYKWLISFDFGYYSFDTRKQNSVYVDTTSANLPLFHQFSMTSFPMMLGAKYRFMKGDIVPFVGLSGGVTFVTQRASYDYSTTVSVTRTVLSPTFQATVGLEFFISPSIGINLEASGWMFLMAASSYAPTLPNYPNMNFTANPILARYSSSMFFLF